jgi:heterodisulfide reductase subunit C
MIPKYSFLKLVEKESGEKIASCFQCQKCSNGCPVVYAMDYPPHRMMRLIQLGMEDELLASNTIWVCATCETCSTRCPNDIEIASVMDILRELSHKGQSKSKEQKKRVFPGCQAWLGDV